MSDEFDAVVARIRERVVPDSAERERMARVASQVIERAEEAVADLPVDAEVIQVGSTARGTWVSGDRDLDVFVSFSPDIDRERLEAYGLQVGHAVLPEGHEEYAEHPYVVGEVEGFDVDLVPCYAVESARAIKSAVDRTPFHTRYLAERLDGDAATEVRIAKQFLKGIGVYGSNLRTQGFSGYLVELLVLEYGGFRPFVEAAADWRPPVRLDPEEHGEATHETAVSSRNEAVGRTDSDFDDPLVVVDPTDPERNVAAALSATNLARLQHYARDLLADPREEVFVADEPDPLSAADVRDAFDARGTTPVAVRFDRPDIVDDQLYPQLEKSQAGLRDLLDRRGFDVLRADAMADDTVALLLELEVADRPGVQRHVGPPVAVREHATGFYEKYADDPDVYGPFIAEDRYVVERAREFTAVADLLAGDAIFEAALGAHVERALADGYDLLVGDEVAALADAFGTELAVYLSPSP